MIIIRIPKDIRDYKEKFIAGLTGRSIAAIAVIVALAAPVIYLAYKYGWSVDMVTWALLLIVIPVGLVGFYQPDNMPFERFLIDTIKFSLTKKELVFTSKNAYTPLPAAPLPPKVAERRSIERAIIFAEANQRGESLTLKECDERLVTVKIKMPNDPKRPSDKNKNKKNSRTEKKEADLRAQADIIQAKRTVDPYYIFSPKEQNILRRAATLKEKKRVAEIKEKSNDIKKFNLVSKKRRNLKNSLPKSTQDVIPYLADYSDGIFELEKGLFSKLYLINDVNYKTESQEKQVEIFATYAEFLNAFDENTTVSVYVDNRVVSKNEQQHRIFYQMAEDELDEKRVEYNRIMKMQMELGRNEMVQEKYIAVTIEADTLAEAISRLQKIDDVVEKGLARIGTTARVLTTNDRLEILHDKFRKGHEGDFKIDFDFIEEQGISSKDYIAPASIFFERKHFMIDDEYYRVMYLNNLPTELGDNFFPDFVDNKFPLTATISIVPFAQADAIKKVDRQRAGMEANILQAQKRAGRQGYSAELAINRKLKDAYKDSEELSEDLTHKGQKMFLATFMIMFSAPTLEELDKRTEKLETKVRRITAQLQILTCRQLNGLRCCLPMGVPAKLGIDRALTSESTATFIPFSCQEISQRDGFYYGLNSVSRNLIMLNRTKLNTPSGFLLGMSGSGKSFAVKREMLNVLLKDNYTTLLIIDPENEYKDFVENFGGQVINISTDSGHHINPMEMSAEYGLDDDDTDCTLAQKKDKALRKKSDYIMSLVNSMLSTGGGNTLLPQQKTFIDKCVKTCYAAYLDNDFDPQYLPTLKDLQAEFDKGKTLSEEARLVAEGTGYYTSGSMDTFAHLSNVNLNNRIVSFSIRDLGEQLMQIALLIILDFIWNKMCDNYEKNVRTYCYVDEIHVLFRNKDSAEFLRQLYKRGRKYGLVITGITQNIEDLLKTDMGRSMVSNSDFLLLLKQAHEDIKILAPMLRMSEKQCLDLERADIGSGILKAGAAVVPFRDKFPQDSFLYKLMSTNFNERVREGAYTTKQ